MQGIKSYVGPGVVVNGNVAIKYDVNGNVTNYGELKYSPNTTKTFVQDYIARVYGSPESFLISRSFAKLREVIIGYSLPSIPASRIGVVRPAYRWWGVICCTSPNVKTLTSTST